MSSISAALLPDSIKYYNTLYNIRFENEPDKQNFIARMYQVVQRIFIFIAENIGWKNVGDVAPQEAIDKLNQDFTQHNATLGSSDKPVVLYLVSSQIDHRAPQTLSDFRAQHKHQINLHERIGDVFAKVVNRQQDIITAIEEVKSKFQGRKIEVVHLVSGGERCSLTIGADHGDIGPVTINTLDSDLFKSLDSGAAIILSGCPAGKGKTHNIADEIARTFPNHPVYASANSCPAKGRQECVDISSSWFSKEIKVLSGLQSFKKFEYDKSMESVLKYESEHDLENDFYELDNINEISNPLFNNIPYSRYFAPENERSFSIFVRKLSKTTQEALAHKVWELDGGKSDRHANWGEQQIHEDTCFENPLVRKAFYEVCHELQNIVEEPGTLRRVRLKIGHYLQWYESRFFRLFDK